jgi:hypothetical protein
MTEIPKGLVYEPILNRIGAVSILLGAAMVAFGAFTENDFIEKAGVVPALFGAVSMYFRKKFDLYPGGGQG